MSKFTNKSILVTGATSGIGKATALYLLEKTDANVIVVARNKEKLIDLYGKYEDRCHIKVYNFDDIDNIASVFSDLAMKLDGMVHCAGLSPMMKVVDNEVDTMIQTFKVNYFSFIELCKNFHKEEISNDGSSIVTMSSIAASVAPFRQTIYSSSKAALEQSIRCVAKEFLDRKIRVNGIAAGAVETEMLQELETKSEGLRNKFLNYYPLDLISPEEIAKTIVFLLSSDSLHIDGSIIRIDSGFFVNK